MKHVLFLLFFNALIFTGFAQREDEVQDTIPDVVLDSVMPKHQVGLTFANGVSGGFYASKYYAAFAPKLTSGYGLHIQLTYGIRISRTLKAETGIGYFFHGEREDEYDPFRTTTRYKEGDLNIPLLLQFQKAYKRHGFLVAAGPDFFIPIHYARKTVDGSGLLTESASGIYKVLDMGNFSTLGLEARVAYLYRINNTVMATIGPKMNFYDLYYLSKVTRTVFKQRNRLPISYFVGLDLGISFKAGR